jgi:hypothetical protein
MNWKTVYVSGRHGFREELDKRVYESDLRVMPGATGEGTPDQALYWLDDRTPLRDFKEAIGGKMIWRYRLRFFESIEDFLDTRLRKADDPGFTEREIALIDSMKDADAA